MISLQKPFNTVLRDKSFRFFPDLVEFRFHFCQGSQINFPLSLKTVPKVYNFGAILCREVIVNYIYILQCSKQFVKGEGKHDLKNYCTVKNERRFQFNRKSEENLISIRAGQRFQEHFVFRGRRRDWHKFRQTGVYGN